MKRTRLTQSEIGAFPEGAHWNAFVDLLGNSTAHELEPKQLRAFYAFWYDSEVQNGGHLQYFYNRGEEEARQAIEELSKLGAIFFVEILREALDMWSRCERNRPTNVTDYVDEALEGEFSSIDLRFFNMRPSMFEILHRHLEQNTEWYVEETP